MKFRHQLFLLATVASFSALSINAFAAEDPRFEVTGGANAEWSHIFGTGGSDASNEIAVNGGVDYFVIPQLELGVVAGFTDLITSSPSEFTIVAAAGPTFNFGGEDAAHSFFIEARAGIEDINLGDDALVSFYYLFGVGHRFPVASHVNWKPEVTFTGHTSATNSDAGNTLSSQSQLNIIPVQFSFTF